MGLIKGVKAFIASCFSAIGLKDERYASALTYLLAMLSIIALLTGIILTFGAVSLIGIVSAGSFAGAAAGVGGFLIGFIFILALMIPISGSIALEAYGFRQKGKKHATKVGMALILAGWPVALVRDILLPDTIYLGILVTALYYVYVIPIVLAAINKK